MLYEKQRLVSSSGPMWRCCNLYEYFTIITILDPYEFRRMVGVRLRNSNDSVYCTSLVIISLLRDYSVDLLEPCFAFSNIRMWTHWPIQMGSQAIKIFQDGHLVSLAFGKNWQLSSVLRERMWTTLPSVWCSIPLPKTRPGECCNCGDRQEMLRTEKWHKLCEL